MNRNYTNFSKRAWCSLVICSCLAWFALPMKGQTVTVSGLSGQMISRNGSNSGTGTPTTYQAIWKHNQAPIMIMVSNDTGINSDGSMTLPVANLAMSTDNKLECYCAPYGVGGRGKSYVMVTLPRGFRFTDYHITMKRGARYKSDVAYGHWKFYETKSSYNTTTNTTTNLPNYYAMTDLGSTVNSSDFTISRQSSTSTDMSNVLYFVFDTGLDFTSTASQLCGITFTDFRISFVPNVDFTTTLQPSTESSTAVNNVSTSFYTGKTDFGQFTPSTKTDKTGYYGYEPTNVRNMQAYNTLYESDCITNGAIDATKGIKTITAVNVNNTLYYGLKNNTYFAECPTYAIDQGGNHIPLGYRITGAKIKYDLQTYEATTASDGYTISGTIGGTTYYLIYNGNGNAPSWSSTVTPASATHWYGTFLESTSGSGIIYCTVNGTNYYLTRSSNTGQLTMTATSTNTTWYKNTNNRLRVNSTGRYIVTNSLNLATSSNDAATVTAYTYTTPAGNYPYTLTVYKNDLSNTDLISTEPTVVNVSETHSNGTVELTNLNNDAIKFMISGLTNATGVAPVTVELTLQPLNPYISTMSVGFEPTDGKAAVTKFVNSYDFNFGDNVQLLIPKAYDTAYGTGYNYPITFNNLKSNYGDYSYYDNSNSKEKSRYNFVGSAYYDPANIYGRISDVANHVYSDKIKTLKAGDKEFAFSNIADLTPTQTINYYYLEHTFTETNDHYAARDGSTGTLSGHTLQSGQSSTYYLFVADETQYNIAPTTQTEHRAYNFYKVTVQLSIVDESPTLTWTRLYPNGYYSKGGTQQYDGDFFAGVKVGAVLTASGATAEGYLMAGDIITKMETEMEAGTATNVPKDMAHVLYIDASNLKNVTTVKVNGGTEGDWTYLQNHGSATKGQLAKNALLFLPENTSTNFTNGIAKYAGNSYKACANIVLTDLQPFYSPYEFIVGGDNYATYKRLASGPNGKVSKATLMLPYTLTLVDGEHVNNDGTGSISLYKMTGAANAFTQVTGHEGTDYIASATFQPVSATTSIANEPYYVVVNEYTPTDGSFVATEYGATIKATPSTATANGRISSATTSSGSVDGTGYTFTNTGTYSGERMDVTTEKVFYFGTDKFLSLQNFTTGYGYVNPFRGYYMYATSSTPAKNFLSQINVDTDDNGDATNITEATAKPVMAVRAGNGYIDVETIDNTHLSIHTLTGQCLRSNTIPGGTRQHIVLPQGIYVVNGVKVVVR